MGLARPVSLWFQLFVSLYSSWCKRATLQFAAPPPQLGPRTASLPTAVPGARESLHTHRAVRVSVLACCRPHLVTRHPHKGHRAPLCCEHAVAQGRSGRASLLTCHRPVTAAPAIAMGLTSPNSMLLSIWGLVLGL